MFGKIYFCVISLNSFTILQLIWHYCLSCRSTRSHDMIGTNSKAFPLIISRLWWKTRFQFDSVMIWFELCFEILLFMSKMNLSKSVQLVRGSILWTKIADFRLWNLFIFNISWIKRPLFSLEYIGIFFYFNTIAIII